MVADVTRIGAVFDPVQTIGKLHRQLDALANLAGAVGIAGDGGFAHLIERTEQLLELVREQFLAKCWVVTRAGEIVVGHKLTH